MCFSTSNPGLGRPNSNTLLRMRSLFEALQAIGLFAMLEPRVSLAASNPMHNHHLQALGFFVGPDSECVAGAAARSSSGGGGGGGGGAEQATRDGRGVLGFGQSDRTKMRHRQRKVGWGVGLCRPAS